MERIPKEERVKVIIALCVVVGFIVFFALMSLFHDAEVEILHIGEEKRIEDFMVTKKSGFRSRRRIKRWWGPIDDYEATIYGDMQVTFVPRSVGIRVIEGIHYPNGVFIPELIDYENDMKKYVFIVIP